MEIIDEIEINNQDYRIKNLGKRAQKQDEYERLWKYIDKKDKLDCWEWTGHTDKDGYGRITINGKSELAHRLVYIQFYGEIPKDKPLITHTCDNPSCCNPNHLEANTHQGNMDDKVERNHCYRPPTGESHPNCVIPDIVIKQMREEYANNTTITMLELSKKYGVSKSEVSRIIRNETRKDENYKPILRNGLEGENGSRCKRTWKVINEIREDWKTRRYSKYGLAKKHNIPQGSIYAIIENKNWVDAEYQKWLDESKKE